MKKDHFLWKRMKKMSWYFFFFLPNRMSIHWLWHGAVHGIFYANFLTWFLYSRKLGRQDVGTGRRVAVTSDLLRFDLHFYFLLFWYIIIFRSHIIPALHICWSDDPMFSSALLLWKKPSSLFSVFPSFYFLEFFWLFIDLPRWTRSCKVASFHWTSLSYNLIPLSNALLVFCVNLFWYLYQGPSHLHRHECNKKLNGFANGKASSRVCACIIYTYTMMLLLLSVFER